MIALTLLEIAQVTGGEVVGDPRAGATVVDAAVVTDARECGPGSLYVARRGEHADGVDFVPQALERGAAAVLADRPVDALPCVVVADVQEAFAALARAVVQRVPDVTVIGITGSSGKTSTKDLLASVLAELGPTVAPEASLNGEVGVPLTALRIEPSTRYLVLEMGARGGGHIRYLTEIVRPDVSVVLNVGSAHLGEFGSVEGIAEAKSEIVQALEPQGLAVLNGDDSRVRAMRERTRGRVVLVGRSADCAVRADEVTLDDQARASFVLVTPEGSAPVRLALFGEHHVANALAVAAVARELGMPVDAIAAALGRGRAASRWRMEVTDRPDGVRVVNDAYNANPDSMRAALKALVAMAAGRRTWAVLGEMLELGPDSLTAHDEIGRLAVRLNVSRLVAVGPGARPIHTGAVHEGSWGEESVHVPDVEAAYTLLREQLQPGDVVLLKSSRDSGLRYLGDRLAADGQASA
ncbi:UDP-N-acetylmuramoyl-tripeptide--D-alanyl-D-alanine ligase [Angustibacter sp. Root456]|uniref:UDP-N-acetylmuramoyl-tripeptide--D-alanyl-D- alanine ligase n=1 Tax=Angustibacter sp. Root456 TaxID=1736539 RepID=UPI0006F1C939|nr:UDP-N-acetylmuramoyl-tripeptide--D-alanyl-D-alanine ligase [Angustibacter sp. Root456]KQX63605.1 UDP-N-acetylmuramoyl-tripeptide--D-alanyl-D-alanine ligase [Angustibacter sp. Root456]